MCIYIYMYTHPHIYIYMYVYIYIYILYLNIITTLNQNKLLVTEATRSFALNRLKAGLVLCLGRCNNYLKTVIF